MASDDDYDDVEEDDLGGLGDEENPLSETEAAGEEDGHAIGISLRSIREWLNARRGWVLIAGLAVAQAVFATIMIYLRSEAKPVAHATMAQIRDLAVDMLGHEVKIAQIYQLIPMRGGKRMTVGLDVALILGQLPEEQIEGAPRPTDEEFALFISTIQAMEPRIRSQINILLQKIPAEDFGTNEAHKIIKEAVKQYVNDSLAGLDFGKGLRPGINKRRVTDVLLPMFVRQKT